MLLASTIMAGTIIYFDSLRELALDNTLAKLTRDEKNIIVKAERGPTTREEFSKVDFLGSCDLTPRLEPRSISVNR